MVENRIILSKIKYCNEIRIKISFDFSYDIYNKIKNLPSAKYSRTLKTWHIAYNKLEYNKLKGLNFNISIQKESGTTDNIVSNSASAGIKSYDLHSDRSSNDIKKDTDIQVIKSGIRIELHDSKFIIRIKYNEEQVNFIKSLRGSWWSKKENIWIAKANVYNLNLLQSKFKYWDYDFFNKLYSIISMIDKEQIIELYRTPDNPKRVWIKPIGYDLDISFLKHLPDRFYDSKFKRWSINFDKILIDRIISYYTSKGVKILNRLPSNSVIYKNHNKSYGEKQRYYLSRFPNRYYEVLKNYSDVLIAQRYSWRTITSYIRSIVKFLIFLEDIHISDVTSKEVNRYLTKISSSRVAESTINMIVSSLKFYFTKVEFRPNFEIEKIKRPRRGRYLPQILSLSEIQRILSSLNNLKHVTLLYTLYSGGMRLSEILSLRVEDINFDRNQIFIKSGKGKKDRVVMLSSTLKDILILYTEKYKPIYWLFEGQDRKHKYSASSVQSVVRLATRKSGITKKVTPHKIRHCFATHLLDGGTDIRYIQELLGHKDIKTTLIYTHVTNRSMKEIKSPLDKLNFPDLKL